MYGRNNFVQHTLYEVIRVTKDVKFSEAMEIVSTLLDYGNTVGIKEFLLTSAPRVYERHPNENLDFAMLWQGFNYDLHYISSAIKLFPNSYNFV